jgi:hypothetical protein
MPEPRRLRVGNHHNTPDYATVIEQEGDDRGVLFAAVVGPAADERAREVCDAVNAARGAREFQRDIGGGR